MSSIKTAQGWSVEAVNAEADPARGQWINFFCALFSPDGRPRAAVKLGYHPEMRRLIRNDKTLTRFLGKYGDVITEGEILRAAELKWGPEAESRGEVEHG